MERANPPILNRVKTSWGLVVRVCVVMVVLFGAACGKAVPIPEKVTPDPRLLRPGQEGQESSGQNAGSGLSGTVEVSADSAYKAAFTEIKDKFKIDNPEVTVNIRFGASDFLAQQIVDGAVVDAFFSAKAEAMEKVRSKQLLAGRSQVFAKGAEDGATYEVGVLKRTQVQLAVDGFVGAVKSRPGGEILAKHGFST